MTTKSSDDRHVVHLHVDAETRTEIRMLAASRGTTIAEAITDLVHTEVVAVGIIRGPEGLPRWCREVAPVEWQCSGRGGRCPAEHLPRILHGVGPAHLHVDLNDVRLGLRAEVLQWLRAHVPAGVEVDDGQTCVLTADLRDVLHDLLTGILELQGCEDWVADLTEIAALCDRAALLARERAAEPIPVGEQDPGDILS